MQRKRLLQQIYIPLILVIITSVFASTWYTADTLRDFSLARAKVDLKARARLIDRQVATIFFHDDYDKLNRICRQIGQESGTRITVILKSGRVVADSGQDPEKMENHAQRLEVIRALHGDIGSAIRYSQTLQEKMLYLAVPLALPTSDNTLGTVRGVLRLSIPITSIDQALRQVLIKIVFGALILVLIAVLITLSLSRKITRPLEQMRNYAERLAGGDFDQRTILVPGQDVSVELADLTTAMNTMAVQLNDRLQTVTKQRNELEAVFSSMVELVIVVNADEEIISMNKAAAKVLACSPVDINSKKQLEDLANPELIGFIRNVLAARRHLAEEVVLDAGAGQIYLQAHGTTLLGENGKSSGALVVLHDVTALRRLENMRRDFVANVSHELRTPITTIKGFVETLQDGAMACPEDADRFLAIILKHADRLNAIVEDLLTLSRIEREDEQDEINLKVGSVRNVLTNAMETCAPKAREKDITLVLACPADLTANLDGPLLEQAVTNLVVNAIKYSPENSEVNINAEQENELVVIAVNDSGVGIGEEHQARLFERFYRSDKARSRKLGGTGLGLAIVKHIVQLHGGTVSVTSTLGHGASFAIHIPA